MKIKIFCTLGPSSLNKDFLSFSNNNIDLLRLNMSHIKSSSLQKIIKNIKKYSKVPICIDTEGSQIRTKIKKKTKCFVGKKIIIFKNKGSFKLYPNYVFDKLKTNDILSIGFEGLSAKVLKKNNNKILLKCLTNGLLETNKGVHLHNRKIKLKYLTNKDVLAINIAKKEKIKNFALSFTNSKKEIISFNKLLPKERKFFKIETKEALHNFKSMTKVTSDFLIDRGDLSKDISIEDIPSAQRYIFSKKNKKTNIAIATNFLESMITKPFPTRGEANDIYTSLEMGASSLVLAAETAVGKYPKDCVLFLKKIINKFKKNEKKNLLF